MFNSVKNRKKSSGAPNAREIRSVLRLVRNDVLRANMARGQRRRAHKGGQTVEAPDKKGANRRPFLIEIAGTIG